MALWKRGERYWTIFKINGQLFRKPLRPPGHSRATTDRREAVQLERDLIEQARNGALAPKAGPSRLFAACDAYVAAKRATANRARTVEFVEERLQIVKDRLGDMLLSTITRETIEGFRRGASSMASATAPSTWTSASCARSSSATDTGAGCRITSRC